MLIVVLLVIPAHASVSGLKWNVHLIGRLWTAKRLAPEIGLDHYYQGLLPYLPGRGRVGFVYVNPRNSETLGRTHLFLQYSLAPHLVVLSDHEDFVIVLEGAERSQFLGDPTKELVKDLGDGLRLFRRTR